MAYQIINAPASQNALLTALKDFLSGAGWTVERAGTINTSFYELLVKFTADPGSGARDYRFSLWSSNTGDHAYISLAGRTGYASGSAVTAQPGHQGGPIFSIKETAMTRAWFFADSKTCHVVAEVAPGYFSHVHFGALDMTFTPPAGDPTGQFIFGGPNSSSYWWDYLTGVPSGNHSLGRGLDTWTGYKSAGLLRLTTASGAMWSGSSSPTWKTNLQRTTSYGYGYVDCPLCPLVFWPRADGSRPLMPINVYGEHSPTQTPNLFLYGTLPKLRTLRFSDMLPATEVTIGADTWVCFPFLGNNRNVSGLYNNYQFGLALKKEV